MLAPNLPLTLSDPSHALRSFDVVDEALKEKFERIIRLARNLFDVPIAAVSFMDEQRTRFKSLLETKVLETPHESSFCKHVLSQEEIFNVPETILDERFRNNPYVLGDPHIRFYAGYPVELNRQKLGTVSIADSKSRYFSKSQLILLKDVAALVETEIQNYTISTDKGKLASDLDQARMASMADPLTGLWNRQGIYNILRYRMDEYLLSGIGFAVALLDIDGFKNINDTYGHEAGDQALTAIAKSLMAGCRETDAIGRWGGEEFLLLINEPVSHNVFEIAERIRAKIESENISLPASASLKTTVTIGLTSILPGSHPALEELIHKADQALYQGKRSGRNQVVSI
ncbi:MAG: diguanylate cyclase [Alphaproteobacteria bacterium]|jgi:diguanylate cyclase (GGDEF)-like protein|nr:diguanylate cyclase [Alphaproteobacteria bacterium]